jgi:cell wall-associated NlpC family hydrolase
VIATADRSRVIRRRQTPLGALGQGVAVAAWGGLAVAVAAPAAIAAPAPEVDVAQARSSTAVSPSVVVPDDAQWSIDPLEVRGAKPAPPPPARQATTASRSTARTAIASAAAPASATAAAVLEIARRYVGVPYVWGGTTPAGFDCSGYTQYVYAQLGISLPRTSSGQRGAGVVVSAADARPGDLVWSPGHIGIYTGNGQHIAARRPGTPLSEGPLFPNAIFIRVL